MNPEPRQDDLAQFAREHVDGIRAVETRGRNLAFEYIDHKQISGFDGMTREYGFAVVAINWDHRIVSVAPVADLVDHDERPDDLPDETKVRLQVRDDDGGTTTPDLPEPTDDDTEPLDAPVAELATRAVAEHPARWVTYRDICETHSERIAKGLANSDALTARPCADDGRRNEYRLSGAAHREYSQYDPLNADTDAVAATDGGSE